MSRSIPNCKSFFLSPGRALGVGTTLRSCCPSFRLSRHSRALPQGEPVSLPRDPGVPQAFLNFPYSLFHSTYFPQFPPFTISGQLFSTIFREWQTCEAQPKGTDCQEKSKSGVMRAGINQKCHGRLRITQSG